MKKSLLLFLLISLIVLMIGPYASYWILMVAVALISFSFGARKVNSFVFSGLSFGLTWMFLTLYISIKTNSDLPKRMAELMGLENDNFLIFGTAILGFLIGSFSGLTGTMVRELIQRKN